VTSLLLSFFEKQQILECYMKTDVYYFAFLLLSNVLTEYFSILLFKLYFSIHVMTVY